MENTEIFVVENTACHAHHLERETPEGWSLTKKQKLFRPTTGSLCHALSVIGNMYFVGVQAIAQPCATLAMRIDKGIPLRNDVSNIRVGRANAAATKKAFFL